MKYSNMAMVVPVGGMTGNNDAVRVQVWGKVSELLAPGLGTFYRQFNPANKAWGQDFRQPFSVVLGKQEPELFLATFLAAQEAQWEAMEFHTEAMIRKANLSDAQKVGETLLCPVVVDGSDPELMAHAIWHISISKGTPLPDCGIYYAALGRATASLEERRAILSNPSGYAVCMVTLSPEVSTGA